MTTFICRLKKLKANSFTLVELLVVISIIGLLAGLATPAIQGGLDKAKQQVDVSNARQLGLILYTEASDNNGYFRVNTDLTNTSPAGNFVTVLQALFAQGALNNVKILAGNGVQPATSTNTLTGANVALSYVGPLTTSDDGMIPLLFTKGPSSLSSSNVTLQNSPSFPWRQKGLVIYRLGNSAEWLKSGAGGAPVNSVNIGVSVTNPGVQVIPAQ